METQVQVGVQVDVGQILVPRGRGDGHRIADGVVASDDDGDMPRLEDRRRDLGDSADHVAHVPGEDAHVDGRGAVPAGPGPHPGGRAPDEGGGPIGVLAEPP